MFTNPKNIINDLNLSGKEIIVDFGVGNGIYSIDIAKKLRGYSGEVYSIDIQKNILKRLFNHANEIGLNNIHYIEHDLENKSGVPLKNSIADIVIISNLFNSTVDKNFILCEAIRLIHEGGHILIIDWRESFKSVGPQKEMVFSEDNCLRLCLDHSLSLDKVIESGNYHYALLFRKNCNN